MGEGRGLLFFILTQKEFDEAIFILLWSKNTSGVRFFIFFMTFSSDAGGHLDQ